MTMPETTYTDAAYALPPACICRLITPVYRGYAYPAYAIDKECPVHNKPKPGSNEAIALGCVYPRYDNSRGHGIMGDGEKNGWWMNELCPLHGLKPQKEIEK